MRNLLAALSLTCLLGCGGSERVGTLRVCLGESDSPRADERLGGFDVDVARLLAKELNRHLAIVWQSQPNMTEIESSDISFEPLLKGHCDLMLSVPGEPALEGSKDYLALSDPYYGAAFELIPSGGELRAGNRVAVRANTVAHVVVDALGFDWTMQPDSAAIAEAVETDAADVGVVWGPELSMLKVSRNEQYEAPELLRWNQHVAALRANDELLRLINITIQANQAEILRLVDAHGVPPHPPWGSVHEPEELRSL